VTWEHGHGNILDIPKMVIYRIKQMKNFFLLSSLFSIGLLSAMDSGLNKSTLNQCVNNNSSTACDYLVKHGSSYQKKVAQETLLIRGL